jgi:cytochrome c2
VPDVAGRAFEPVAMTKHCQECHTLEFEPAVTSRQVPHGTVDGVMSTMQEFYANIALNAVIVDAIDTGDIRRRLPRPVGGTMTDAERQRALSWAREKADKVAQDLFEARVCVVCHEVVKAMGPRGEQDGIAYGVAPVHVASTWLPAARFDHGKHRTYKCEECHDKVAESKSSADVAIPTIDTCRKCHGGSATAAKKVASTCIDCHAFHLPNHAPMGERTAAATGARP